jgi:spore maturation protein CgeB
MVEIFNASRVNLNLSGSWSGPVWRRRLSVGQIKARVFEVPGSGGFLLTERSPHLERFFELEREVSVFNDTRGLIERVHFWLAHEDARAAAAQQAYERVLREHTYDHRFKEIFSAAGLAHA